MYVQVCVYVCSVGNLDLILIFLPLCLPSFLPPFSPSSLRPPSHLPVYLSRYLTLNCVPLL